MRRAPHADSVGATPHLWRAVVRHKRGEATGMYAVCSANRHVITAAMLQALEDHTPVCIESTSNQVNQFGGYAGMKPRQFAAYVREIAAKVGLPGDRVILGGDHLGPYVWRRQAAGVAMENACALVRSCIRAGYTKIHLDASMRCADDPKGAHGALDPQTVTERAVAMCEASEAAHQALPRGAPAPLYIIGTEVPAPGGERGAEDPVAPTSVEDAKSTIAMTRHAFQKAGLLPAWDRVIAVVVQPGVEFSDARVFAYQRDKAAPLSRFIESEPHLVYEAHSTDYQTPLSLRALVEDHFAILKVGPWLTFAFREAVFALERIEQEWLGPRKGIRLSQLSLALDRAMLANPIYWRPYYQGDHASQAFARKYSLSDRCRYYWPDEDVQTALLRLCTNLAQHTIPLTLLSQFLPAQYQAIRENRIRHEVEAIILHRIREVTHIYAMACGVRHA